MKTIIKWNKNKNLEKLYLELFNFNISIKYFNKPMHIILY